jgi:hypothetical protein
MLMKASASKSPVSGGVTGKLRSLMAELELA